MRDADKRYFDLLENELNRAMTVAETARKRGGDPSPEVEIPVATDMADRVENLLGIPGVAERVRELEVDHSREEAALALVEDFVDGSVGDFDARSDMIEGAVRTAVALLTEGVVAAPIEGIDRVELLTNDDGTEFVNVYYAGPIRSAGGTAQALSVLVADYARSLLDIDEYRPREEEVGRYAEEVGLYDEETGLQYSPSEAETRFIAEHMPIMLDGEATGGEEVSGHRDLERVGSNAPRGGMCLVLAEGIALKAPKIQRYTRDIDAVHWPWLQDLIDGNYDGGDREQIDEDEEPTDVENGIDNSPHNGPPRVTPSKKYLRDLIAGRPVLSHPSESGGFRLRYGRARNHGFATAGVHPATMHLIDDFLATGTQIKTERPGKAAGVVPVDSIEGPTVRLANGDVRRIDDPDEALDVRNGVEEVLDLGEYLVNYGEFVENNHALAPASYTVEWWIQEFESAGAPVQALADRTDVDLSDPTVDHVLDWATQYEAPLHPSYTYLWHDISVADFLELAAALPDAEIVAADGAVNSEQSVASTLSIPRQDSLSETLETLLVEHTQRSDALLVSDWRPLATSLGFEIHKNDMLSRDWTPADLSAEAREYADGQNAIKAVNELAPFTVRERAPTRVGNRMGRPEKSETRELSPAVHTLFPIGEAGGDQRSVTDAASQGDAVDDTKGRVSVEVGHRACVDCGEATFRARCPDCGEPTRPVYRCPDCDREVDPSSSGQAACPRCNTSVRPLRHESIDVGAELESSLKSIGERESSFETLKAVKGLSSREKVPEPLEKGILRAKHGVSAFKDGTVRYDMTDLPVTAVRPAELGVSVERFRELGYHETINGDPLEHDDQLVELQVQDVVLSIGAAEHLQRTADFVDDLLESYYGLEPYYGLDKRDDLVGELVFGMAPHTSAAVVGRVVGFTTAAVGYAHPYFHASKRRNCFHPKTKVWVQDDSGEWQYRLVKDLVETHLQEPRQDGFGTQIDSVNTDLQVPSLTTDGESRLAAIESVSKHPSPDHLLRIETRRGRSITVTPDHSMRRWTSGVEECHASEINPGDLLPTPNTLDIDGSSDTLDLPTENPDRFSDRIGSDLSQTQEILDDAINKADATEGHVYGDGGDVWFDEVTDVEIVESGIEHTYCLTVSDTHTLVANDLYTGQCDGDEDCVMLLMDGLLNFSKRYLPDKRGGRMDAPLVMSSRIDPAEIDDEAHNMDVVERYPLEFYEATRRLADPGEIDITLAAEAVGTDDQYRGFAHTHDTSNIAAGPSLSAYKTLGSMEEKMEAQLELARILRAVDETDVAERVIEYHFLPDLIGNLRAFSRQETRCHDCGTSYRRMPLSYQCHECGGDVHLTVHEGSVTKYLETAKRVAEEYGSREYTKQRLEILERSIERVFENDRNKQSGIADFM